VRGRLLGEVRRRTVEVRRSVRLRVRLAKPSRQEARCTLLSAMQRLPAIGKPCFAVAHAEITCSSPLGDELCSETGGQATFRIISCVHAPVTPKAKQLGDQGRDAPILCRAISDARRSMRRVNESVKRVPGKESRHDGSEKRGTVTPHRGAPHVVSGVISRRTWKTVASATYRADAGVQAATRGCLVWAILAVDKPPCGRNFRETPLDRCGGLIS